MILTSGRGGGYGGWDLWLSERIGSTWQAPTNLGSRVNTPALEGMAYLTQNCTKMYFVSTCSGGEGAEDIYYCDFNGGNPGNKVNVGTSINTPYNDRCPVLTPDGSTMFLSSDRVTGGYGSSDIWISKKVSGVWALPVNLGPQVNSAGRDAPQWVSDDGETLLISSDQTGTYGLYDLWVTTNNGGVWSKPVNLGEIINTRHEEHGAKLFCNFGKLGGFLYFSSNRPSGEGDFDIWYSVESSYTHVNPSSYGRVKAIYH